MGKWDEFEFPRERAEAYPTMRSYADSRTLGQLATLICVPVYQGNVFGTYPGTAGEHSQEILASVQERALLEAEQRGWRKGMEESAEMIESIGFSANFIRAKMEEQP